PAIWILAVAAGFSHSFQSANLDFYLREYAYFTLKEDREKFRNPSVEEALREYEEAQSPLRRTLCKLRMSWIWQQRLFTGRGAAFYAAAEELAQRDFPALSARYRHYNLRLLHLWRPLGANVHTAGILLF